jgi:hypothetical protein
VAPTARTSEEDNRTEPSPLERGELDRLDKTTPHWPLSAASIMARMSAQADIRAICIHDDVVERSVGLADGHAAIVAGANAPHPGHLLLIEDASG